MLKDEIKDMASGSVSVSYRNKTTGESVLVLEQKNLITYGAADIIAKLIAGDSRYAINGMYFQFENTPGSPNPGQSIDRSSGIGYFNSLDGPSDWLRVPIITSGKIAKSPIGSVSYSGNSVTFVATTGAADVQGEGTYPFSASDSSKIFSLALVAMPVIEDKTKDVIFSRANLLSSISAIEGSYIDIFWTISLM